MNTKNRVSVRVSTEVWIRKNNNQVLQNGY